MIVCKKIAIRIDGMVDMALSQFAMRINTFTIYNTNTFLFCLIVRFGSNMYECITLNLFARWLSNIDKNCPLYVMITKEGRQQRKAFSFVSVSILVRKGQANYQCQCQHQLLLRLACLCKLKILFNYGEQDLFLEWYNFNKHF